jgi:hypothetical protein
MPALRRELLRHRPVIEALDRVGDDVRDGARRAQEMPTSVCRCARSAVTGMAPIRASAKYV